MASAPPPALRATARARALRLAPLLLPPLAVCAVLLPRLAKAAPPPVPPAEALEPARTERLARGAEVYRWNCSVCHGVEGGGLAEARLAFPPDHRRCERCHRPSNRAVMSLEEITHDNDLFSLGDPPALVGDGALSAFPNAAALAAYTQATMPRYEPGRLSEEEYMDVAVWLLEQNGR